MSANPERGEVDLVITRRTETGEPHPEGDKAFVLRMRTHDVCAMEQRTGKTFGQLMDDLVMKSWSSMRECVFAFLQPYHAGEFNEPAKVNWLLDEIKYDRAMDVVTELIVKNRPPKPKDGKANPRKAQAGTGRSSNAPAGGSV